MTNLELLKQALDNIIEVNNFYRGSNGIRISTTNLEFIINKLSFCEKFDIPLRLVVSSYGDSLKLYGSGSTDFNIIHNPYLTNKQTHYKFDENKNSEAVVETVKYSKGEIPQINDKEKQSLLNNIFTGTHSRFESYNDCDVICLNLIDIEKYTNEHIPVYVILEKNKISFYTTEPDYVEGMFRKIMHEPTQNITTDCLLYHFMNKLIFGDLVHLEEIERKLSALETNAFSGCTDKTFSKQILNNLQVHLFLKIFEV